MGVEILKKPTDAERATYYQTELSREKAAHNTTDKWHTERFEKLARFALANCQGYCSGDRSVGIPMCEYCEGSRYGCELKHVLGIDGEETV